MPPNFNLVKIQERVVHCPFNSEHVVFQSTLQKHIIRCMKNYPGWLQCPYNALHRSRDKQSLLTHMLDCPSKKDVCLFSEADDVPVGVDQNNEPPFHIKNIREFNLAEENWDDN